MVLKGELLACCFPYTICERKCQIEKEKLQYTYKQRKNTNTKNDHRTRTISLFFLLFLFSSAHASRVLIQYLYGCDVSEPLIPPNNFPVILLSKKNGSFPPLIVYRKFKQVAVPAPFPVGCSELFLPNNW